MNTYNYNTLDSEQKTALLKRPKIDFTSIFGVVQPIIEEVGKTGDQAVREFTSKFDGVDLDEITIDPSQVHVDLDPKIKSAIDLAFENIRAFHEAQKPGELSLETMPGIECRRVSRPIERVGMYVPGGTAVLPSSAMMLTIPAMIAGCSTKVLATPPGKDGTVAPEIIYIAQKAQVDTILLAGGAQAVAALAFGTESVPKVDKILGPGNQYVTAAKMILQNSEAQISIDMPAGPSEVLVIADKQANPAFVAADLLSQAEHGADSQVVLVAVDGFDMEKLETELSAQLDQLPRKEFAKKALEHSYTLQVSDYEDAFAFSNNYAPEHLIINIEHAEKWTDTITNAGSVFLGAFTPESVGDYASGTNHTLPTYGYARMYSGVNLGSYLKSITMQSLTEEGIQIIGPAVETLAELEGLQAHKNAVTLRLNAINKTN
ncbi:MAG TPA: histidinol dehydrogenase [Balneolaceae bacterium]|nr:histidinol dehydrogenase [Balneolaceae bacterium]|tara:strand:+ start:197270 stop:198565 length:1296 start_codon:yes stop_codon:yes gene_type:complete